MLGKEFKFHDDNAPYQGKGVFKAMESFLPNKL